MLRISIALAKVRSAMVSNFFCVCPFRIIICHTQVYLLRPHPNGYHTHNEWQVVSILPHNYPYSGPAYGNESVLLSPGVQARNALLQDAHQLFECLAGRKSKFLNNEQFLLPTTFKITATFFASGISFAVKNNSTRSMQDENCSFSGRYSFRFPY